MKAFLNIIKIQFMVLLATLLLASTALAGNFLWQVKDNQGHEIYLMGSFHLARAEMYPLSQPIMDAFSRSQNLAVELDSEAPGVQAKMMAVIQQNGLMPPGQDMHARLSSETRAALAESGFDSAMLNMFRPWMAALDIQMKAYVKMGLQPELGLDSFFMKQAKERGMKIIALETVETQLSIFTDMTPQQEDLFLRATLVDIHNTPDMMNNLLDYWQNGEVEPFAELIFEGYHTYPELVPVLDRIIYQRNVTMTETIEKLFRRRNQVTFVVIGAAHLAGDGSILDLLRQKGYQVTQL